MCSHDTHITHETGNKGLCKSKLLGPHNGMDRHVCECCLHMEAAAIHEHQPPKKYGRHTRTELAICDNRCCLPPSLPTLPPRGREGGREGGMEGGS